MTTSAPNVNYPGHFVPIFTNSRRQPRPPTTSTPCHKKLRLDRCLLDGGKIYRSRWTNRVKLLAKRGTKVAVCRAWILVARPLHMNIRFTSSLTPEDENLVAPGLLRALTSILDLLPIAYVVRVDTSDSKVYEQSGGMGSTVPIADSLRGKTGGEAGGVSRNRAESPTPSRLKQP